jgi:hypothetical protein
VLELAIQTRRVDMKNRILLLLPSVVLIAAIAGGWFDGS